MHCTTSVIACGAAQGSRQHTLARGDAIAPARQPSSSACHPALPAPTKYTPSIQGGRGAQVSAIAGIAGLPENGGLGVQDRASAAPQHWAWDRAAVAAAGARQQGARRSGGGGVATRNAQARRHALTTAPVPPPPPLRADSAHHCCCCSRTSVTGSATSATGSSSSTPPPQRPSPMAARARAGRGGCRAQSIILPSCIPTTTSDSQQEQQQAQLQGRAG